jgi:hypothetical protein
LNTDKREGIKIDIFVVIVVDLLYTHKYINYCCCFLALFALFLAVGGFVSLAMLFLLPMI